MAPLDSGSVHGHTPVPARATSFILLLCGLALLLPARASAQDLTADELERRAIEIFERSCTMTGCHGGPIAQQNMFLTSSQYYESIVDQPSVGRPDLKRVDPGNPEGSYLIMKVRGDAGIVGLQMPMVGDKLTEEEIETLEQWIRGLKSGEGPAVEGSGGPAYPFDGWKAVNLPTTRTVDKGRWLFLISHRFNPRISSGYDSFYGLDGSGIIYLSLGYAITDQLVVSLARSNSADNVELWSRYSVGQQGVDGWPLGLAVQAAGNWVTEEPTVADRTSSEAFKLTLQVPATMEIVDGLGLGVVPGVVLNPVESVDGEDPLLTVGLAAQWNFHRNLSFVGEWAPIVSGYTRSSTFGNDIRFDSWGGGFQITTGGHVFQIIVSNSVGLTGDQYLRGGDLDIRDGHMRLGFNIFRVINF
ncbi:MAG: DUF5777 family beta-barrel protein [Rhodothermales bacterium]|nr:DUF5777 family beta-barrel protein [Rhodothermales bacterium]